MNQVYNKLVNKLALFAGSLLILISFAPHVQAQTYCIPIYDYGCSYGDDISNVTLEGETITLNNSTTACSANGYQDYTSLAHPDLTPGNTYTISISTGYSSPGSEDVRAWIDYNNNGTFEAIETIANTNGNGMAPGTVSYDFTVPTGTAVGDYRLRVRLVYNSSDIDPCTSEFYGETEDYTVSVISSSPCSGMPSAGTTIADFDVCPLSAFTISTLNASAPAAGLDSKWQSSPEGANIWTDIAGANSVNFNITAGITAATDYRYIRTCTNSNLSDTSDVLTVTLSPGTSCYCEPSYSFGCSSDNIRDVILAGEVAPGINNLNTPCPPTGYQDYSATMSATLLAGNTYSGNVTTDYSSASENVRIWIDYNQNGIFEANETVATLANLSSSSTGAFSFTVPPTTPTGTYKMRVRLVWSTSPLNIDPCTVESFGETHDYTILIDGLCTDPIVDLGPDVTICEGESVTLDAGNPGLDFEWNDNSTGQTLEVSQSGTYTVTVTDGDCSTTASVEVTVQDLPTVDLGGDETICEGESITLDAGNPGADFEWSDNSTGQTLDVTDAGTYTVTVTEGTCSASDTVEVSYFDAPSADGIIANNQDECFYTFSVDNAQNATYYEWDFGDGSPATIGANVNHTYTANGAFIVTLTMVNDCEDTLTLTHEVACSGIGINEVIADKNAVTLYPNPTTDQVTIESAKHLTMEQVTVYNVLGQNVYQDKPMSRSKHAIDVSKMASGVYTIHVQTNDGVIIRKFEIIK